MTDHKRDVGILQILNKSLGYESPMIQGTGDNLRLNISLESLAFDIKRKAYHGIEIFDAEVAKLAKVYYGFESVYRENLIQQFVSDANTMNDLISKNPLIHNEVIRLVDDKETITKQRIPVGHAYLNIFSNTPPSDHTVSEEDFWRCFDFRDLGLRIPNSEAFKVISKIFLDDKGITLIDKLEVFLVQLNESVVRMSKDYETVVTRILDAYVRGETISESEAIDLESPEIVLCGVVLKPYIANTINRRWHGTQLTTQLGNSLEDIKVLLQEPYGVLNSNDGSDPNGLSKVINVALSDGFEDKVRTIQRIVSSNVDQVVLSSRRLTRMADNIRDFSDRDNEDSYNTALRDVAVLIAIYSGSLIEVLKFSTLVAYNLNASFKEFSNLTKRVQGLNTEVTSYINLRKKNVISR